jgi:hypothetical protein
MHCFSSAVKEHICGHMLMHSLHVPRCAMLQRAPLVDLFLRVTAVCCI